MGSIVFMNEQTDSAVIFIQNEKLALSGYNDDEETSPIRQDRALSTKNSNKNALEIGSPDDSLLPTWKALGTTKRQNEPQSNQ